MDEEPMALSTAVSTSEPAFATDPGTARYYHHRAPDYDDWYTGHGRYAEMDRPGWHAEVAELVDLVRALPAARTIDVACGTGFLTRHLRGFVIGLDQSAAMASLAQSRLPNGLVIMGDALHVNVTDHSFDRVFTGHFYGHLPPAERAAFLTEARRLADELVVVDSALRAGVAGDRWQERELADGSLHQIYKRYLSGEQLAAEIGGGDVLMDGKWFVAARAAWGDGS
jgi:ubiquinone/menaquinone biosynthesis C-methylase UbiE